MSSLDHFAIAKLKRLERQSLRRELVDTSRIDGVWVTRGSRRLLSFSCNDYLNLSSHPRVKAAAIDAIDLYGAGAGASRLVTGNHPLLAELESRLALLKGAEAACVFGSGYLANMGVIPALVGVEDLILVDGLAHACIMAGAKLSGSQVLTFRHNDMGHLGELLSRRRAAHRHVLIATETVFSMDGDLAPLDDLARIAASEDCWLLADDAHGIGVLGGERLARDAIQIPLLMGTLSKALGSYGGYLCASRPVIELMKSRARTLIYSTGLPPASAAAALAALDIIEAYPSYAALPLAKARRFTRLLDLPVAQSPIVPVVIGDAKAAIEASRLLEDEGFLVVAIRPPTVPGDTARLRIAFTALHPDAEIERLADALRVRVLPALKAA